MFNIGFGELAVICIVLIIVVGPERLPSMMKTLGKTIRTLRQASRDIRASTGIDELMREDFDLYAPIKPVVPKPPPAAVQEQPALPTPQTEAEAAVEPTPVSREDGLEVPADRPSVVVAPPPQSIGSPALQAAAASEPGSAGPDLSLPSETEPAIGTPAERVVPAPEPTMLGFAPVPSSGDTLPRAALPEAQPAAVPSEPKPTTLAQAAPEKTESAEAPDAPPTSTTEAAGAESSRETKQSGA